ncbi:MAG: hypothetical protein GY953_55075 [bacterium]|nr:hypothetical protein [bacterium]
MSLSPIREYVLAEAQANLDQFLGFHPACQEPIEEHDRRLEILSGKCRRVREALRASPGLQQTYEASLSGLALPSEDDVRGLFGAYPHEEHLDVLAELIVNNTDRLPSYYTTAPLWNQYATDFLELREADEIRPVWQALEVAGANLAQIVSELIDALNSARGSLSLQYDVPIAERLPLAR